MLAVIAIIVGLAIGLSYMGNYNGNEPESVPVPNVTSAPTECACDKCEWDDYYGDAYAEYCDEFTALFNSYTYKVSKNGRSMVNGKFVAMAKGK